MTALAPTLQTFFTDYMQRQRKAARTRSPHTATPSGCCSRSPPSAAASSLAGSTSATSTPS